MPSPTGLMLNRHPPPGLPAPTAAGPDPLVGCECRDLSRGQLWAISHRLSTHQVATGLHSVTEVQLENPGCLTGILKLTHLKRLWPSLTQSPHSALCKQLDYVHSY